MGQGEEGVLQSWTGADPLLRLHMEHLPQEVHKGPLVLQLTGHSTWTDLEGEKVGSGGHPLPQ